MNELTPRQQEILEFLRARQEAGNVPSVREIAAHFGFRSMSSAMQHIAALRRKGFLVHHPHRARALQMAASALSSVPQPRKMRAIPIYGAIPAGFARDREQEVLGCISVDVETLGIRPTARTFALQVKGDSMIGKHIVDGDYVILEHGLTPKHGDVVAALIDNESTLKTFLTVKGKPVLRAENPRYPELIPARELVIQGVMIALIRKR